MQDKGPDSSIVQALTHPHSDPNQLQPSAEAALERNSAQEGADWGAAWAQSAGQVSTGL